MADAVEHQPERHRFVIHLAGGDGELVYRQNATESLELLHTGVDPALRGRGVAGTLAQAAFDHARAEGLSIVPTCPYIQRWLESHPEQADLVAGPGSDGKGSSS